MKHYSTWIAKAIKRYLRKNGVRAVTFDRNEGKIEFIVPSHSQIAYFHYVIQVKRKRYTIAIRFPAAPEPGNATAMANAAAFLSRVNTDLDFDANDSHLEGYFDLNCNSGMIQYLYFVQCPRLPAELIRCSLEWPVAVVDRVVPGLVDILYKGSSPDAAMADYAQRVDQASLIRLPSIT